MEGLDVVKKHPTFKVGGHVYQFEPNPRLIAAQGMWGQCNHIDRIMRVDSTIKVPDFLSVLLHELFEAIKANREIDLPHYILQNMEDALHTSIVDNKELFLTLLSNL